MSFAEFVDVVSWDIAFWSVGLHTPDYPLDQLGSLALEVGDKLRAVAVMRLLDEASINGFCHNLVRSAVARVTFLERCLKENGTGDRHFCAGRTEPLLDAIAAGDFARAVHLDALTPDAFRPGVEYEDDFCFAKLLGQLACDRPDPARCAAWVAQWEAYLEGADDARLPVIQALLADDAAAFAEAFEERLVEREAEIDADKERGQQEEPKVVALRLVFVEGVALLRLADKRGLATEPEYRMCPSLARIPMSRPFPGL
jgi:hypothetical protein